MAGFGRHHRINTSRQYRDVFNHRNRRGCRFFTFHHSPNDVGFHRLGLAVSRKVSKSAVKRNRIKRLIRESFRAALESQPETAQGLDVVVVAKPAAATADNAVLRRGLDRHWQTMG